MIFPPEIWERIFLYIDPLTLINMRITCKYWKNIIDQILQRSTLWYKLCKNEIPENLWSTLCETLNSKKFYTDFHERHDAKFWLAMYKLWIKCKTMTKCDTQSECVDLPIETSLEYITCIDTSENLIAIGSSEGYIYFYNTPDPQISECSVDHMEFVQSVKIIRDETNVICVSCSINNHISFWDVNSLKLVNGTRGKLICTSYSYCYIALRNIISIEGGIPRRTYEFNTDNVLAIGANYDRVLFYTESGYFVNLSLEGNENDCIYTYARPPNIRIRQYHVFKPNIVTCITDYGYVGFLVQGQKWKIYNVFSTLYGTPTAILVYGHILILGLDTGYIHIFYVNDFRKINFETITSKKLYYNRSSVISLNIMVNAEEYYLIVGYSKRLYYVKFM
ncbi:hypothetical protein K0M31_019913 [Melipona bicolor]|uniref:F-box domain-containing protein n=2 Tax=Melipona bicolor TaxID=60889 RepID=A0AA40G106_9HYME|nr:hypothetical protein K0M31_019913 [Melipona bicolor]